MRHIGSPIPGRAEPPGVRQAAHLLGRVARPEHRALAERVREAERVAAPGVQIGREVAGGDRASHDDAVGEVGDAAPLGDLLDHAVRRRLDRGVAVAVDAAAPDRGVGRDRDEDEQVLVTRGRDMGIRGARPADVERGRIGDAAGLLEDVLEVRAPVLARTAACGGRAAAARPRRRGAAGARRDSACASPTTSRGTSAAPAAEASSRCGAGPPSTPRDRRRCAGRRRGGRRWPRHPSS